MSAEDYVGEEVLRNARAAFRDVGFELDPDGHLRPLSLENLEGAELTDALRLYIRRARSGHGDAALVTSTGKDLLEAASRHVLVEKTGAYDERMLFPMTLYDPDYELKQRAKRWGQERETVRTWTRGTCL